MDRSRLDPEVAEKRNKPLRHPLASEPQRLAELDSQKRRQQMAKEPTAVQRSILADE
jgi:hypothetical protein